MDPEVRVHIRYLLWHYKKIQKNFEELYNVLVEKEKNNSTDLINYKGMSWSANQIVFHKNFLQVVTETLAVSSPDTQAIFQAKYQEGFPGKGNDIVAYETYLSESTVKRRDNEFLKKVGNRLGWLV
ncbi:transcriptional regulator [Enterococcus faecalis]